jgi:hypothetical protein
MKHSLAALPLLGLSTTIACSQSGEPIKTAGSFDPCDGEAALRENPSNGSK